MKKISLLICLIFSFSTFAQCEKHYERAARKRARTIMFISYGVGMASPAIVLLGGGVVVTSLAWAGMIVGGASGKIHELNKKLTTFGKVSAALKGDTGLVSRKVARYLKREGVEVDKDDPQFITKIQDIIQDLNTTEKACPYLGYDKKFQDIMKVYTLKEFSQMIKDKYISEAL